MEVRELDWRLQDVSIKSNFYINFSPDIYIFDDVMSALDAKVGAFITEETILKQLKGKTVVLVTHGLQYLKYSDYVYVFDDREIALKGKFEEVQNTELYQKFLELDDVKYFHVILNSGGKISKMMKNYNSKR